jgi:hypothetical protein
LRIATTHNDVPAMLEAYNGSGAGGADVQLPDLLAALSYSIAKGFLRHTAGR